MEWGGLLLEEGEEEGEGEAMGAGRSDREVRRAEGKRRMILT